MRQITIENEQFVYTKTKEKFTFDKDKVYIAFTGPKEIYKLHKQPGRDTFAWLDMNGSWCNWDANYFNQYTAIKSVIKDSFQVWEVIKPLFQVPEQIIYGMFAESVITRDHQGLIEILVIVQESGLFAGRPPDELRIHEIIPFQDEEYGKQYCAELNRRTDLPFYLAKAKIRVEPESQKEYTLKDLEAEGIKPLPQ